MRPGWVFASVLEALLCPPVDLGPAASRASVFLSQGSQWFGLSALLNPPLQSWVGSAQGPREQPAHSSTSHGSSTPQSRPPDPRLGQVLSTTRGHSPCPWAGVSTLVLQNLAHDLQGTGLLLSSLLPITQGPCPCAQGPSPPHPCPQLGQCGHALTRHWPPVHRSRSRPAGHICSGRAQGRASSVC